MSPNVIQAISSELGITETQARILSLASQRRMTAQEICDAAGVSYDVLRVMMTRIRERLDKGGVRKVGIYELTGGLQERVSSIISQVECDCLWTRSPKIERTENVEVALAVNDREYGADGRGAPTPRPPLHQRPDEEACQCRKAP